MSTLPTTVQAVFNSSRAAALCALLCAAPAWAQSDDPLSGRALFEDTINVTGNNMLTGNCTSCHATIQDRRTAVGGSPFADISFTTALSRFTGALQVQPAMAQFNNALDQQQVRDIAAYIADTPKTSVASLDFTASAVNIITAQQSVDLRHAVATNENLTVVSVAITGISAARFSRTFMCDAAVLSPGTACSVGVSFSPLDTSVANPMLRFTLRQGASATTFERTVSLSGTVAGAAPPGGGSTGGGAFGGHWLAGLAFATLLLGRRRAPDKSRLS